MHQHVRLSGGVLIACILLGIAAPAVAVAGVLRVVLARPATIASTTTAAATTAPAATTTTTTTAPAARPIAVEKPTTDTSLYRVRRGDNLTTIAARLHVAGGWPVLYAVNRHTIGTNPDLLHVGVKLTVPRAATPARVGATRHYTVAPGDTLRAIADRYAVHGGWQALYDANRHVIGKDPNRVRTGVVLTIPRHGPATGTTAPTAHRPTLRGHRTPPSHAAPPPTPPIPHAARHAAVMPGWVRAVLIGVALLVGLAFVTDYSHRVRRRRQPMPTQAGGSRELISTDATRSTHKGTGDE